ncbi:hypothetical protein ACLI1A_01315 [Flavobacterium sp. RHBU_3]|uniref:hypothetical protein n=1 Tax=Flavobacterium sp. RHBU_3 TaxID=3391184 RepID=UPI0039855E32
MGWLKTKREYVNSVKWGAYGIGVSFFKQVCLLPAFLHAVGYNQYSFWLVLFSISSLIASVSLGHYHFVANYFNLVYKKGADPEGVLKPVVASNFIYAILQVLGVIFVCLPGVLSMFSGFSESYIADFQGEFCFIFLFVSRVLFFYATLFLGRLLEPFGYVRETMKIQTVGDLFDVLITLLVVLITGSLLYACFAVALTSALFFLVVSAHVKKRLGFSLRLHFSKFGEGIAFIKESFLLNASFFVEKAYEQGVNLIVVLFFSAQCLPIFATTRVISNVFYRFSLISILPLFPEIQKYYVLGNYKYTARVMQKFWVYSSFAIILVIVLVFKLLPYIYELWTKGEIKFNLGLITSLFIGVLFQNFATIIYEFFKKVNLSWQMLLLNVIRVAVICLGMFLFGRINYIPGLGIAFLSAELLCCFTGFAFLQNIFGEQLKKRQIVYYLFPVLFFSCTLGMYMIFENYLLVCAGGLVSLGVIYKLQRMFSVQKDG